MSILHANSFDSNGQLITLNACVILSASIGDPDLDKLHHLLAKRGLGECGCKTFDATGVWRGIEEQSIVVPIEDNIQLVAAISCAITYQQEAVLIVSPHGEASIVTLSEPPVSYVIGDIIEVSEKPDGDHTKLGGRYFVNVPREEQDDEPVPA